MNKLILNLLKDGQVEKSKNYKSLKEIQKDFPEIEYHQLREIYLFSTGRKVRNLHGYNKTLLEMIQIVDDIKKIEIAI